MLQHCVIFEMLQHSVTYVWCLLLGCGWIMSALDEVERLQDDNKYYCDKCVRLVEAERSTHYVTLPHILTLHLKRFAATTG